MNRVVLEGPLRRQPVLGHFTRGTPLATVMILVSVPLPNEVTTNAYEMPCLVTRDWLPTLLRWQEQGFHLRVDGHLLRETIWYDENAGGLRTVQVYAEAIHCVDPVTHEPTGFRLGKSPARAPF